MRSQPNCFEVMWLLLLSLMLILLPNCFVVVVVAVVVWAKSKVDLMLHLMEFPVVGWWCYRC